MCEGGGGEREEGERGRRGREGGGGEREEGERGRRGREGGGGERREGERGGRGREKGGGERESRKEERESLHRTTHHEGIISTSHLLTVVVWF